MNKILLSIAIVALVGVAVIGGTTAIFSDSEVSTGNTFTAGAIDLTVDNESYYNGVFNEATSWLQKNLEAGNLFFDFRDLKPGDYGEDTISLHVNNNDSYLCADVTLRSNTDNGSTEPEQNDEVPYTPGEGELADNVHFLWWADDGDNVLETGEIPLPSGTLGALNVDQTATVALADSNANIWNDGNVGGALPGDSVRYIGKAWCFGNMVQAPLEQDNLGTTSPRTPANSTGGFTCDGSPQDNSTQTDGLTADISFRAVQSRNNSGFLCTPPQVPTPEIGTLIVNKVVTNDSVGGPDLTAADFNFTVDGGASTPFEADGSNSMSVAASAHSVVEDAETGYTATYSNSLNGNADCNNLVVPSAGNVTCTITNNDNPTASLKVDKILGFSSDAISGLTINDFTLTIDGPIVGTGDSQVVADEVITSGLPVGTYTVSEVYSNDPSNVIFDTTFSGSCTEIGSSNTGTITLGANENLTCTITNIATVTVI